MWIAFIASLAMAGFGIGIYTILIYTNLFFAFPNELTIMIFNAMMGVIGIVLYSLNIPYLGWEIVTIEDAVYNNIRCTSSNDECIQNIDKYKKYLYTLIWCSNSRFIAWYFEYINSLLFIMFFLKKPYLSIVIQYLLHSINFILSIVCLIIVLLPDFPMLLIPYSSSISPIVIQCVIVFIILFQYKTIYYSKLYALKYEVIE